MDSTTDDESGSNASMITENLTSEYETDAEDRVAQEAKYYQDQNIEAEEDDQGQNIEPLSDDAVKANTEDTLAIWLASSLAIWQSDTIWQSGTLAILQSGILACKHPGRPSRQASWRPGQAANTTSSQKPRSMCLLSLAQSGNLVLSLAQSGNLVVLWQSGLQAAI